MDAEIPIAISNDGDIYIVIGVFVLLFISSFFSASETALTAVSRAKIHKLKTEGNKRAQLVDKLRQDKDRLIAAILLGNNVVNILASALMTALAIHYFGNDGVIYATIVMTVLITLFSEVMPKAYAFTYPERVALLVAPLMRFFVWLFTPFTHAVQIVISRALWLLGDRGDKKELLSAMDVLKGAIELHHEKGAMVKEDKHMLGSIIDLSSSSVEDVMVHRKKMFTIGLNQKQEKIARQILGSTFTRIPVWRENPDNIVGILHVKAYLKLLRATEIEGKPFDISLAILEPWFVPSTTSLKEQMQAFREKKSHMALVVDEYGDLQGLVTLEDIIEDIIGHIEDEHYSTVKQKSIRREQDNSCVVDGTTSMRDLNREMDWNLSDEEASTVAGYVIYEAQRIPDIGQVFHFNGYRFEILHKLQHQLTRIRVSKLTEQEEDYFEEEE